VEHSEGVRIDRLLGGGLAGVCAPLLAFVVGGQF